MTQVELDALLKTWQVRLKLQDWDVTAEIKRARDMLHENTGGEVEMILSQRRAWITLRDTVDIREEALPENSLELILVHELLHLLTEPLGLPGEGPIMIAEEQALNAISQALVALDRESKTPAVPRFLQDEDFVRCQSCGVGANWGDARNWSVSYARGPGPLVWCSKELCQDDFAHSRIRAAEV